MMDLIKDYYPDIRMNIMNIPYDDWRAYLDKVVKRYENNKKFSQNFNSRLLNVIMRHENALHECHLNNVTIQYWKVVKYGDEEFIEYTIDYEYSGTDSQRFTDKFGQIPIELLDEKNLIAHEKKWTVDNKRKAKRDHKRYQKDEFQNFLEKYPKEAMRMMDKHLTEEAK